MSADTTKENLEAKELLHRLKSGALLKGTVRSHLTDGSVTIARVGIELPSFGEREVMVKGEPNLRPGQTVVIRCVPDPAKPERYIFQTAGASQAVRTHRADEPCEQETGCGHDPNSASIPFLPFEMGLATMRFMMTFFNPLGLSQ